MAKGFRKYQCDDCKHEAMEHWIVRNRAARVRCPRCGSAWYDLKNDSACAEQLAAMDNRRGVIESMQPDFCNHIPK